MEEMKKSSFALCSAGVFIVVGLLTFLSGCTSSTDNVKQGDIYGKIKGIALF